ncbi:siderophore-interacting protein [Pseudooceanicola sp. CBS1P-1]|uniref:Siderophore-interacting protein n=1 Tax=Pseudooceanicola albus TaxID=2692189 RepID=A0A6L7G9F1_9RHOB|nr:MULTISPECIES: siderophore-interacting protein [Pseudooceanicola]MBT9385804.1 siderophore-interacting protein [Pseudooceanicola endophyticus]MXN20036.1 siderophore-interacting protein [Pseudooceanicola albus]
MTTETLPTPVIERHRFEIRRRALTVTKKEMLTPQMIRLTLTSPDLADFASASFDDHVKCFFDVAGAEKPAMRDYTPRRFDTEACELVLDFAVHEAGPATAWAVAAEVGSVLNIGGPRGSRKITGPILHWVLIGDETALPAIGRFCEEAPAGTKVTVIAGIRDAAEEQVFDTAADLDLRWVHRGEAVTDPAPLLEVLQGLDLAPQTFVWTAAEGSVTQALRAWLLDSGHPLVWTKSAGYWVRGTAESKVDFD